MTFSFTASTGYDLLKIEGPLTVGTLIPVTSELNKHASLSKSKNFVLEGSLVTTLDANGIRLIMNLKKRLEEQTKSFYLLRPSKSLVEALSAASLIGSFQLLDSTEILEKQASENLYEMYIPYSKEEKGLNRINCSCAICGSTEVSGYITNQNNYDWQWIKDEPFPTSYVKNTKTSFDYFGLLPVICLECGMSSIRLSDFNVIHNGTIAIKTSLNEECRNILAKSIKKRKKTLDSEPGINKSLFDYPRSNAAIHRCFVLAEQCVRSMSIQKEIAPPFVVGYINYLSIMFAEKEQRTEYINNCRTWFTQCLQKSNELTMWEKAVSHFILLMSNINLSKIKEATVIYNDFTALVAEQANTISAEGIISPLFWYNQGKKIWENEIQTKSSVFKA